MTKFNYFNNTGGINKFSSIASLNESEIATDWLDAQNVEGHKSGGIMKMKGNINICKTQLPENTKILGIFDYTKGNYHYPIINTSEGKLYRLNLSTGYLTEIFSGLSQSAKCNYANYNNGVIITNGIDRPVFYEEGYTAVQLGSSSPVGVPIEIYKARVFIASGSNLHYSALGNQNDWTTDNDAGFIENFHNDSSPIIALENYGEYLAIYKKNSTYILSGSSPSDYLIKPISDKGSVSTWGIATVNNNQYFFNGDSITPLKFNEIGQIKLSDDVSIKIKPLFDELDISRFNQIICIPYQKKNQIWFFFPSKNTANLNVCFIYDYLHNSWYKRIGIPITSAAFINGCIYTGTSDGRILLEDFGDNFDGAPIEAWWYSPWFSFRDPVTLKEIINFNVWLYQDQKYPIEILYSKDFNSLDQKFTSLSVSSNDDLVWDNDVCNWDFTSWSDTRAVRKKIQINGQCESLQIGVKNLEADQFFSLIGYSFDVNFATP